MPTSNNDQSNALLPKNPTQTASVHSILTTTQPFPNPFKPSKPSEQAKMKREGRQHGMVRSNRIFPSLWNPRPEPRFVNRFDSPPTAGLFTKVPSKPTNHSKFTGKCGRPRCVGCHIHPARKSKDKTKGTHKLRSCDVVSNYRLINWRVVDGRPGSNFAGVSASGILNHLGSDCLDDDDGVEDCTDDVYEGSTGLGGGLNLTEESCSLVEVKTESGTVEIKDDDDNDDEKNVAVDHGDDEMSFCEVGFVWEQVDGDGGWCVVGESSDC